MLYLWTVHVCKIILIAAGYFGDAGTQHASSWCPSLEEAPGDCVIDEVHHAATAAFDATLDAAAAAFDAAVAMTRDAADWSHSLGSGHEPVGFPIVHDDAPAPSYQRTFGDVPPLAPTPSYQCTFDDLPHLAPTLSCQCTIEDVPPLAPTLPDQCTFDEAPPLAVRSPPLTAEWPVPATSPATQSAPSTCSIPLFDRFVHVELATPHTDSAHSTSKVLSLDHGVCMANESSPTRSNLSDLHTLDLNASSMFVRAFIRLFAAYSPYANSAHREAAARVFAASSSYASTAYEFAVRTFIRLFAAYSPYANSAHRDAAARVFAASSSYASSFYEFAASSLNASSAYEFAAARMYASSIYEYAAAIFAWLDPVVCASSTTSLLTKCEQFAIVGRDLLSSSLASWMSWVWTLAYDHAPTATTLASQTASTILVIVSDYACKATAFSLQTASTIWDILEPHAAGVDSLVSVAYEFVKNVLGNIDSCAVEVPKYSPWIFCAFVIAVFARLVVVNSWTIVGTFSKIRDSCMEWWWSIITLYYIEAAELLLESICDYLAFLADSLFTYLSQSLEQFVAAVSGAPRFLYRKWTALKIFAAAENQSRRKQEAATPSIRVRARKFPVPFASTITSRAVKSELPKALPYATNAEFSKPPMFGMNATPSLRAAKFDLSESPLHAAKVEHPKPHTFGPIFTELSRARKIYLSSHSANVDVSNSPMLGTSSAEPLRTAKLELLKPPTSDTSDGVPSRAVNGELPEPPSRATINESSKSPMLGASSATHTSNVKTLKPPMYTASTTAPSRAVSFQSIETTPHATTPELSEPPMPTASSGTSSHTEVSVASCVAADKALVNLFGNADILENSESGTKKAPAASIVAPSLTEAEHHQRFLAGSNGSPGTQSSAHQQASNSVFTSATSSLVAKIQCSRAAPRTTQGATYSRIDDCVSQQPWHTHIDVSRETSLLSLQAAASLAPADEKPTLSLPKAASSQCPAKDAHQWQVLSYGTATPPSIRGTPAPSLLGTTSASPFGGGRLPPLLGAHEAQLQSYHAAMLPPSQCPASDVHQKQVLSSGFGTTTTPSVVGANHPISLFDGDHASPPFLGGQQSQPVFSIGAVPSSSQRLASDGNQTRLLSTGAPTSSQAGDMPLPSLFGRNRSQSLFDNTNVSPSGHPSQSAPPRGGAFSSLHRLVNDASRSADSEDDAMVDDAPLVAAEGAMLTNGIKSVTSLWRPLPPLVLPTAQTSVSSQQKRSPTAADSVQASLRQDVTPSIEKIDNSLLGRCFLNGLSVPSPPLVRSASFDLEAIIPEDCYSEEFELASLKDLDSPAHSVRSVDDSLPTAPTTHSSWGGRYSMRPGVPKSQGESDSDSDAPAPRGWKPTPVTHPTFVRNVELDELERLASLRDICYEDFFDGLTESESDSDSDVAAPPPRGWRPTPMTPPPRRVATPSNDQRNLELAANARLASARDSAPECGDSDSGDVLDWERSDSGDGLDRGRSFSSNSSASVREDSSGNMELSSGSATKGSVDDRQPSAEQSFDFDFSSNLGVSSFK